MIRNQTAPDDCRLAPELYLDYTNPWALGALMLAGTGLVMTTISMGVLWSYWNTPIVRACSRELSSSWSVMEVFGDTSPPWLLRLQ